MYTYVDLSWPMAMREVTLLTFIPFQQTIHHHRDLVDATGSSHVTKQIYFCQQYEGAWDYNCES